MKTTMYKKDLTFKDGFPKDIDREKLVVVQVRKPNHNSIILYTDKSGDQATDFLNSELLYPKYAEAIYILKK